MSTINILSKNLVRKAKIDDIIDASWYTVTDINESSVFFKTDDGCYNPDKHKKYTLKEVYDTVTNLGYVLNRNNNILMVNKI